MHGSAGKIRSLLKGSGCCLGLALSQLVAAIGRAGWTGILPDKAVRYSISTGMDRFISQSGTCLYKRMCMVPLKSGRGASRERVWDD